MAPDDLSRPLVQVVAPGGAPLSLDPAERDILARINQKVAAAESLEALVDFLFHAVQPIFDCDRVGVSFLEEDGARLVAHYTRAAYDPILLKKGYAEELKEGSLARVIQGGRPRIIRDLERYQVEHPSSRSTRILLAEGVRSNMACPLLVEGRVAGVLFFSSRRRDAYTERHVQMHLAIAERLAQAVDKARRIEELAQANRAYFEMLGFVSHELKSPLASIVMEARALSDGYLGPVPDPHRQMLAKMIRQADYLLNLVREYLDLARIEGGGLGLRPRKDVNLVSDVLEPAWEIVRTAAHEKRMQVEWVRPVAPLLLTADPDLLKIVAVNLAGNAIKYGRDEGRIRIQAAAESGGGAWFSVWNEGPGFPESLRPRLFRRFSRLETPELMKRKGTGVGLYTSWRIVKLHGGRIDAASEEGAWAEFRVDLPAAPPAGDGTGAAGDGPGDSAGRTEG